MNASKIVLQSIYAVREKARFTPPLEEGVKQILVKVKESTCLLKNKDEMVMVLPALKMLWQLVQALLSWQLKFPGSAQHVKSVLEKMEIQAALDELNKTSKEYFSQCGLSEVFILSIEEGVKDKGVVLLAQEAYISFLYSLYAGRKRISELQFNDSSSLEKYVEAAQIVYQTYGSVLGELSAIDRLSKQGVSLLAFVKTNKMIENFEKEVKAFVDLLIFAKLISKLQDVRIPRFRKSDVAQQGKFFGQKVYTLDTTFDANKKCICSVATIEKHIKWLQAFRQDCQEGKVSGILQEALFSNIRQSIESNTKSLKECVLPSMLENALIPLYGQLIQAVEALSLEEFLSETVRDACNSLSFGLRAYYAQTPGIEDTSNLLEDFTLHIQHPRKIGRCVS